MPLVREFDALLQRTLQLWARYLPRVGTWLMLGWVLYTVCLMASASIGNTWGPVGAILFVVGVTANVVGVIFAIHSLKDGLLTPATWASTTDRPHDLIPAAVFAPERKVDVAILAIGPVLGVYALWAIVDQMIRDGLVWNTVIQTVWNTGQFSISRNLDALPFYLTLGGIALAVRVGYARLVRQRSNPWWRVPLIFFEGLWVFATFFIVLLGFRALSNWSAERAFWRETLHAWHAFREGLPDIRLPFDLTLPEFLQRAVTWLTETFLPGLWNGLVLPLVWLAVVAIVFGWREFRARELLRGRVGRTSDRLSENPTVSSLRPVWLWLTTDLRDKYVPLFHAFRLIWHSGPFVLGAYLVMSALIEAGQYALNAVLLVALGSDTPERVLATFSIIDAVDHLVVTSLSLCLYAAAFDRGLADALGMRRETVNAA